MPGELKSRLTIYIPVNQLTNDRLAGLPENVLQNAQLRAGMLKVETQNRAKLAVAKRTRKLLEYAGYAPGGADGTSGKVRPGKVLKLVGMLERSLR